MYIEFPCDHPKESFLKDVDYEKYCYKIDQPNDITLNAFYDGSIVIFAED